MRLLFDEYVPRTLRSELAAFEVRTVQEMGWVGIRNGALLERAAATFDVLFTVDLTLVGRRRSPAQLFAW